MHSMFWIILSRHHQQFCLLSQVKIGGIRKKRLLNMYGMKLNVRDPAINEYATRWNLSRMSQTPHGLCRLQ